MDAQGTPTHQTTDLGSAANSWRKVFASSLVLGGTELTAARLAEISQDLLVFIGPAHDSDEVQTRHDIRTLIGDAATSITVMFRPPGGGGGGGGGGSAGGSVGGAAASPTTPRLTGTGGGSGAQGYVSPIQVRTIALTAAQPLTVAIQKPGAGGAGGGGGSEAQTSIPGVGDERPYIGAPGSDGGDGGTLTITAGTEIDVYAGGAGGAGAEGGSGYIFRGGRTGDTVSFSRGPAAGFEPGGPGRRDIGDGNGFDSPTFNLRGTGNVWGAYIHGTRHQPIYSRGGRGGSGDSTGGDGGDGASTFNGIGQDGKQGGHGARGFLIVLEWS